MIHLMFSLILGWIIWKMVCAIDWTGLFLWSVGIPLIIMMFMINAKIAFWFLIIVFILSRFEYIKNLEL